MKKGKENKKSKGNMEERHSMEEKHSREVFQQDLSQEENPGAVFIMKLLFKEPPAFPEKERMTAVMEKHLGEVDCFCHDEKGAGFGAREYLSQTKEGTIPAQLMIMPCSPFDGNEIDSFRREQMWDCREDRDRILSECRYQVFATDIMAVWLGAKERAALDMDFMEALVELYPACEAVYFFNSGKLILAKAIKGHQVPRDSRFVKFAVNARFFNIQGTDDMMVDTLGMSTLFLPDLQYHFHGMDPNWVVHHAYNIADYILANDNPIQSGDTIDGIAGGAFSQEIQWRCQYENALIQPVRQVIDICMNEYASGRRE